MDVPLSFPQPSFKHDPLPDPASHLRLLEILDDRYDKKSTLITSQLPVEQWHDYLGDPTLADAILRSDVEGAMAAIHEILDIVEAEVRDIISR